MKKMQLEKYYGENSERDYLDGHDANRFAGLTRNQRAADLATPADSVVLSGLQRMGLIAINLAAFVRRNDSMRFRQGQNALKKSFGVGCSLLSTFIVVVSLVGETVLYRAGRNVN